MTTSDKRDDRGASLKPIRPVAAHELVLEQIRSAVMLGRYQPGESLPPERDLAKFLNVSRTTVREAVAVLVAEGLLEVKRGRGGGLFVRPAVSPAMDRQSLAEQRAILRTVFDFRIAVESSCAELAASRRSKSDIRRLLMLHDAMSDLTASNASDPNPAGTAKFLRVDSDFHTAIGEAARSPQLAEAMRQGRLNMFRPVGGIFNRLEDNADHLHGDIIDAIEAKDGELARSLMRQHIEGTRTSVEAWLRPRPRRLRS